MSATCRWPTTSISERLAAGTVGLTGADIRNLVNEAALWATRQGKDKVDMDDFEHARDKVLMGAKREEVLTGKEKADDRLPRGGPRAAGLAGAGRRPRAQGHDHSPRPGAGRHATRCPRKIGSTSAKTNCTPGWSSCMGGRAAEKLVFDEYSAGAENDLTQATQLARRMVTAWGMSERLGPVAYRTSEEHPFLGKEISRAARVQRAHGPADRRRGRRASCTRAAAQGQRTVGPAPRQARQAGQGA